MYDMKKLAGLIKDLEEQLIVCMRCGMCQAVCPLFAETGRESDVARGKLALLDGLIQEIFKDPRGVNERLMRCLLCGTCAVNCPSGVKVLEVFIKARAIITGYMGLNPLKRAIFRGMLVHPEFFDGLLEWGAKLQRIFVKPVDDLLGASCVRFMPPLAERRLKPLDPVPFHRRVKSLDTAPGSSGLRVAFFVGCVIDKVFPNVGAATIKALEHHGVGIYLPEQMGCCGIPALSSGDTESFDKLVRHNLRKLASEQFDYLVTACATCTSTIKKMWPMMAGGLTGGEREQMAALVEKTMDVTEFLVDKAGVKEADGEGDPDRVLVTYHDPCHLRKSLGVAVQPRIAVKANPRYRLKEMAEPDRCCGCGGSFNLQHYDVSAAIGMRKRESIVQSGCSVVATSCPACMLQITDMLSREGDRVQVKHAVEIYADALKEG